MFRWVTGFEFVMVTLLVTLAAAFWMVMEAVPIAKKSVLPLSASSEASADPMSIDSFQMQPFEDFSEFLDRPLFSPARRPPEIVPAMPEAEPAPTAPAPKIELTGLIITAQGSVGIIRLPGTDGIRRIVVGDTIEGWEVEEIAPSRLLLRRGDQHATVSALKMGDTSVEPRESSAKSPP